MRAWIGLAVLSLSFMGCAAVQESRREQTMVHLKEAGFVSVPFSQVASDQRFASLPPYELTEVAVRSGVLTCYYDRSNQRVLTGGPREAAALRAILAGGNSARSREDARRMVVRDCQLPVY
jgi:hypothetical protein